jgi:hypothetical protein
VLPNQVPEAWAAVVTWMVPVPPISDTFIEGPDATRLLAAVSANNYENFAVGQAKQFVPVAGDGNIITDGILLRTGEHAYILSGVSAAQEWVEYHAGTGESVGAAECAISASRTGSWTLRASWRASGLVPRMPSAVQGAGRLHPDRRPASLRHRQAPAARVVRAPELTTGARFNIICFR